jgi:fibronectin type 3 domain-containing protein
VQALPRSEDLVAQDGPDSIRLDWHAGAPLFRIYRKMPADADWAQIGTGEKPSYSDTTIEYGRIYQYFVQSIEKTGDKYAESEDSASVTFTPKDKFPPAVPTGLTAVPGTRTIELVWERNGERDFASYSVYRDGKRIAEMLGSPTYSDKDVKAGTTYRYQVSAVDAAGNESALSGAAEAAIP